LFQKKKRRNHKEKRKAEKLLIIRKIIPIKILSKGGKIIQKKR
jgi:hypothetical protein